MLPRPKFALLGSLLVLAALLGGCGSDSTGTSTETAAKPDPTPAAKVAKGPCQPRAFSGEVEPPVTSRASGEAVPIEIGATKIEVTTLQASFPKAIEVVYGRKRSFEAPAGAMLVAVTYRLENQGPGEVKPSADFNSRTLLRVGEDFYPYATALPCDIALTASWASSQGGTNPAFPVPVDESAKSAVVFIVPNSPRSTELALVVPGQVAVELRGSGG